MIINTIWFPRNHSLFYSYFSGWPSLSALWVPFRVCTSPKLAGSSGSTLAHSVFFFYIWSSGEPTNFVVLNIVNISSQNFSPNFFLTSNYTVVSFTWMPNEHLKLGHLQMNPSFPPFKTLLHAVICVSTNDISILPVSQTKKFGVIFDSSLSLNPLIQAISKFFSFCCDNKKYLQTLPDVLIARVATWTLVEIHCCNNQASFLNLLFSLPSTRYHMACFVTWSGLCFKYHLNMNSPSHSHSLSTLHGFIFLCSIYCCLALSTYYIQVFPPM